MEDNNKDDWDFSDVEHGPAGDQQTKLRKLVKEQVKAQDEVKETEGKLDAAKKYLATYRDDLVPAIMREMGIQKQTVDGYAVSCGDVLEGSLPKDPVERAHAIAWLDAHGGGAIVDREIVITLPRNAAGAEKKILDFINKSFPPGSKEAPKSVSCDTSVHHSSLKSHAMEFVKKGIAIPLKELGLTLLKRAKVTPTK